MFTQGVMRGGLLSEDEEDSDIMMHPLLLLLSSSRVFFPSISRYLPQNVIPIPCLPKANWMRALFWRAYAYTLLFLTDQSYMQNPR